MAVDRRSAIAATVAGVLGSGLARNAKAQAPAAWPPPTQRSGVNVTTPCPGERISVVTSRVTLKPKETRPPHRHPGFVVGYVVSGKVIFKTENEAEAQLTPGEMFFEPANALHEKFENPSDSDPALILLTIVSAATR